MSRTYSRGTLKEKTHKHGHCYICGYDPKNTMRKKTEKKTFFKFNLYPNLFLEAKISQIKV